MLRTESHDPTRPFTETASWLSRILAAGVLVLGTSATVFMLEAPVIAASQVDLIVNPPPALAKRTANSTAKPRDVRDIVVEVKRGASLSVNATISNLGSSDSGLFDVRVFLAKRYDGSGPVHEFDVVRKVSAPAKGQVQVTGEYMIPFYPVIAGRSYWLVVEADAHDQVVERDERNNRQVLSTVFVPCDDFKAEEYIDEYLCPKFGEND